MHLHFGFLPDKFRSSISKFRIVRDMIRYPKSEIDCMLNCAKKNSISRDELFRLNLVDIDGNKILSFQSALSRLFT